MRFSSSRRLWLAALALGCIAGAILVVALLLSGQSAPRLSNSGAPAVQAEATVTATIASLLDIPLYPGAQDVEGDPLNDNTDLHARTTFTLTALQDDVLAFYEKALVAKGWLTDDRRFDPHPSKDAIRLRWFDRNRISPYALAITISRENFDDGHILVQISRAKEPDIYFLPLYPDATSVERTDVALEPPHTYWRVITTTFTTRADPTMIKNYYTSVMAGIGCEPYYPGRTYITATPPEFPDIGFNCSLGSGPLRSLNYVLILRLTSHEGNLIAVEMIASGFDVGDRNNQSSVDERSKRVSVISP